MSDHPSPCTRQQHSGDCELETLARQDGRDAAALSAPLERAHEGRFVAEHCRRFRRVHLVRPLHPRLQRNSRQLRAGPHGQGRGPRASRSTTTCRWANSSCVSCGECMVSCPTGALTNKVAAGTAFAAGASADQVSVEELAAAPRFQGRVRNLSELESRRGGAAEIPARRNDLPRGRIRLDRVLHSRRESARFDFEPYRARENRRGIARIARASLTSALAQRKEDQREEETSQRFDPH